MWKMWAAVAIFVVLSISWELFVRRRTEKIETPPRKEDLPAIGRVPQNESAEDFFVEVVRWRLTVERVGEKYKKTTEIVQPDNPEIDGAYLKRVPMLNFNSSLVAQRLAKEGIQLWTVEPTAAIGYHCRCMSRYWLLYYEDEPEFGYVVHPSGHDPNIRWHKISAEKARAGRGERLQ